MTISPSESRDAVTLREITLRLTGVAHAALGGRLRVTELVTELRAIADWIEGGTKPARPVKEEVTTQVERELFDYWVARFNKTRTRFTNERRRCLRARLREGYTAEDIRRAIDGCKASGYHNGENDTGAEYNDLTLICRNGTKLERFRDMARESGAEPLPVNESEETTAKIDALSRESLEALKRGDTNAYNRTQDEIKGLRSGGRDGRPSGEAARPQRAASNR